MFKKNLDLHLRKMQIYFYLKKNSDLHPRKMQICFSFKKNIGYMQIIEIKEEITPIIYIYIYISRSCFKPDNN